MATITHQKTNNIPDPTQVDLDAQIALGNYPSGTLLADITLPQDWNANHTLTLGADENFVTDAELAAIGTISGLVPYIGATGDVNLGTHALIVHNIKPDATDGLLIESNNGTDIGILGAGNTANATWYGNHNYNTATASTMAHFGASKTLESKTYAQTRVLLEISSKAIPFGMETVSDGTAYLTTYAPYAGTINSIQNIQTTSGTVTIAVKINGTNVTGLSAVAVTSSSQDVTATAANTFAVGDEITLVRSSNSSGIALRGTILITQ